jgi:hypothetical protein
MRVLGICRRGALGLARGLEVRRARWVRCVVVMSVGVGLAGQVGWAEKKAAPWVQIPLDSLGFPGVSSTFLAAGGSVLTVHFLDSSHLLVTYGLRKLVPRVENDPEDHEDRLVAGLVVDLPSGKIEAQTEWHMHDHGRYLWSLGNGRFLIRIGEQLYTMAPLKGLVAGNAFARTVFPGRHVRPSLVDVSADGGVVTVETVFSEGGKAGPVGARVLGDEDTAPASALRAVIDFFRIAEDSGPSGFEIKPAGSVLSRTLFLVPLDADGYLWADDVGGGEWSVTFDGFGGKTIDLGKIQSSCRPRLQMTSRSEFVAMTCQGSDDRLKMASFGLDGTETWEDPMGNAGAPTFAFAPAAARFAVSGNTTSLVTATGAGGLPEDDGPRQEVRVYQNASGDLLLKVECTPSFKTAENFDLSADGLLAAVVRNGAIAVYKLPPLTKRDQQDMAEVGSFAPPASLAQVTLKRLAEPAREERVSRRPVTQSATVTGPGAIPQADFGAGAAARKPPTLLKAGEKPEFGTGNAAPE